MFDSLDDLLEIFKTWQLKRALIKMNAHSIKTVYWSQRVRILQMFNCAVDEEDIVREFNKQLDRFSIAGFIEDEEENQDFELSLSGTYEGVGIELDVRDGKGNKQLIPQCRLERRTPDATETVNRDLAHVDLLSQVYVDRCVTVGPQSPRETQASGCIPYCTTLAPRRPMRE
jgi:hypothetical protein